MQTSAASDALAPLESASLADLEHMDGLFCALIASPGGERHAALDLHAPADARLLERHWHSIVADFDQDGMHVPVIQEPYVDGVPGRAWARGFMQGVAACAAEWAPLFSDENEGYLISIPLVAGAIDPAWPRAALTDKKIDEFLTWMAAGAERAYRHFAAARTQQAVALFGERAGQGGRAEADGFVRDGVVARTGIAIGRMALCPCGSHRKYKRCCGEFRTR